LKISVCREVFATICTYCLSFKCKFLHCKCETLLLAFIVSVCMFVFNRCMQRLFCLFKNSFPSYVIFFIHNSFQLKVNLAISYLIRHSIPVDDLLQSTESSWLWSRVMTFYSLLRAADWSRVMALCNVYDITIYCFM
jgi:hypothetical protein